MQFQEVEKLRINFYNKIRKARRIVLFIALGVVVIFGLLIVLRSRSFLGLFPVVFFGLTTWLTGHVITYFLYHKDLMKFYAAYKKYFVESALLKVFPGCSYEFQNGISRERIAETGMMNTGDIFRSEDLVKGEYKGLKFEQSDMIIQEESRDSDGNTTTTTIFSGRYAIFDIKRTFDFRLGVVGKGFQAAQFRRLNKGVKFRKIQTESVEFQKRFRVYAEDGFEAFYLLDPAFIARVDKLGEAYKNRVALFFVNGELHIAVNDNKNSFEPSSYRKPLDEKSEVEKIEKDIKLITDIVDSLKLK